MKTYYFYDFLEIGPKRRIFYEFVLWKNIDYLYDFLYPENFDF